MADTVRDIMTPEPQTIGADATLTEAARLMRDHDTGALIVGDGDRVDGIVTDRDIVLRGIAEGRDGDSTRVSEVATMDVVTVSPDSNAQDAVRMMREQAIRRLPVVEGGRAVGIISLGDLAIERDSDSALADISSAPPNN